jgi:hypothetical protein
MITNDGYITKDLEGGGHSLFHCSTLADAWRDVNCESSRHPCRSTDRYTAVLCVVPANRVAGVRFLSPATRPEYRFVWGQRHWSWRYVCAHFQLVARFRAWSTASTPLYASMPGTTYYMFISQWRRRGGATSGWDVTWAPDTVLWTVAPGRQKIASVT